MSNSGTRDTTLLVGPANGAADATRGRPVIEPYRANKTAAPTKLSVETFISRKPSTQTNGA